MAFAGSRLETIFLRVREYANQGTNTGSGSGYIDDNNVALLLWVNQCTSEIAQTGYWRKSDTLDLVAGTGEYSLIAAASDIVRVNQIYLTATGIALDCAGNWGEMQAILADTPSGTPHTYFIMGDTLKLAPAPDVSTSAGLTMLIAYHPGSLDVTTNYTPLVSMAYDDVYTWYSLWAWALKNPSNVKSALRSEYWQLYTAKLASMLQTNPRNALAPLR
jgi:hypothetical protein